MSSSTNRIVERNPRQILLIAAWIGLISGLVEGLIYVFSQQTGKFWQVTIEILWIPAFSNLILFLLVALGIVLINRLFPRLPALAIAIFLFSFVTFADWITVISFMQLQRIAVVILAAGLAITLVRVFSKKQAFLLSFFRKSLPWLFGLAFLMMLLIQGGSWIREKVQTARLPTPQAGSPNILFIVADTLRADHLSYAGYPRLTSPNIDRLASTGVVFDNAFSTSSYSLSSHVSLMTGLYTYEHGVEWDEPARLNNAAYPTIAEKLKEHGYRTGGFSANLFWVTRETGFGRGFIHFEDNFRTLSDMFLRTFFGRAFQTIVLPRIGYHDIPARRRAPDINRSVLDWTENEPDRPFFIFINYLDPHDPYMPPEPFKGMFDATVETGGRLNTELMVHGDDLTPEQIQAEVDAYDASIAYTDHSLQELLSGLQEQGLADNLLVILTSDHGESFKEHGVFLHGNSLYKEEIHVPLIVWWPDKVSAGIRIDQPVSNVSVPATILDLIGQEQNSPFKAPSLVAMMDDSGAKIDWPDPLAEMAQQKWKPQKAPIHSGWLKTLVGPAYQYIEHELNGEELYDWRFDPQEQQNLVKKPEMGEVVSGFRAKLEDLVKAVGIFKGTGEAVR